MIYQREQESIADEKRVARAVVLALAWCLISQDAAFGAPSIMFASSLGGSQWDTIRAIATDTAQNIYVVGETYSQDFPGAAWSSSRQTGDAFVVKLSQTGTRIYTVILGGSGYDSARGVVVDSAGNVYVTGLTSSVDFPATAGAFQRNSGSPGQYDAFVAKISPPGSVLYATFLGGSGTDAGYGVALDSAGAVYVAGSTNSMNFPITSNAPQSRFGGSTDCFVAKLDPTGSNLSYATYLGGENMDSCTSIAVDATGAAFVTGTTSSTKFPTAAALYSVLSGASDAFVTKISPAGGCFLFSTYLGGEGADNGNVVRVDSAGNAYVAGDTMSAAFPVTSGAFQTQIKGNGSYDGFLGSIAGDGSAIRFATYLGGTGTDSIRDLTLATDGGIVVAGYTASMDFPLLNPLQSSYGGGAFDAFAAVLSANGSSLVFATYAGGGGDDRGYGVAALGAGQMVFAGQVVAGPVPYMQQLYGSTPAGQYDGFLAAISYGQPAQGLRFVPILPRRRYAQSDRSFRRTIDRRQHEPGLCHTQQCVRRALNGTGVLGDYHCHAARRDRTPDRMAEWTATTKCVNAELLGWPREIQFCNYSGRERRSDQHLRQRGDARNSGY
jgi:Beta-propeller repeat